MTMIEDLPLVEGELLDLDELARVRAESWIARSDRGFEVLTYDEGLQVLEHPGLEKGPTFKYRIEKFGLRGEAKEWFSKSVPASEGEYRKRLRAPLAAVFRPSQISKLRDAIRAIAQSSVGSIEPGQPVDFMEQVGWVVPSQTYCELVSIPYEMAPQIRYYGESILGAILPMDTGRREETEQAILDSIELARHYLEARRGNLGDDFISALIRQQERGVITEEEMVVEAFSILQASVDNTAQQMGNVVGMLTSDPDRWAALRADPSTVKAVIEEAIRLAPRFCTIFRYVPNELEINGVRLPQDSWIFVSVRAGQRDPLAYEVPDAWNPSRTPTRPLMFGAGPYNCLGQNLARMEIEEVLLAMIERFDDIAFATPWIRSQTNAVSESRSLQIVGR
ncbi:cytochrome P450 [Microbacterium sp.]|uniref:cytochrome P450 n=1 Tax=Microbacterium sp. TaxID=51671 RepID=UPI003A905310